MKYYFINKPAFASRLLTVILLILYFNVCGPPDKLEYATVEGSGSVHKVSPNITILFNNPPDDSLIDNYLINLIYETADDAASGRIAPHTHLDVCLYDFDRDLIIEALEYAVSKNVHVRFVGDMNDSAPAAEVKSFTYSSDPGYLDIARALDGNPAYAVDGKKRENFPTVSGFDPRSEEKTDFVLINSAGIMHHKFVLISKFDGKYVFTGSTNASDNDILRNNNNSLVIKNEDMYNLYKQQFEYMLSGDDPVNTKQNIVVDNVQFDISFAYPGKPSNFTHDLIVNAVNNAGFSIKFMIFSFFHDGVASAISGKSTLERMGIFDESQISGSQYYSLRSVFQCRIDGNENTDPAFSGGGAKLHHKVMILDNGYPTARVITGSSNWSVNANSKNDENLIIINSRKIAEIYTAEFQKRWDEAKQ